MQVPRVSAGPSSPTTGFCPQDAFIPSHCRKASCEQVGNHVKQRKKMAALQQVTLRTVRATTLQLFSRLYFFFSAAPLIYQVAL